MNKRRLFLVSAIASSIVLGTAAYAGPGGKNCDRSGKYGGDRTEMMQKKMANIVTKLDLNETQQQQMKELMETYKNAMKPLKEQKRAMGKQMRALDPTASDYNKQLTDIANQKAELVREMTIAKGKKRQSMANILTPEQRTKMKDLRSRRMEHRGKYRGGE